ncbi:hypothetical protein [Burkholderia gladioli]|uniref:hypothetical protein n=1 Tax=Burkholderia gladioli TaxID=28095 RepID=UPI0016416325|nr:hypothetical protein [Burkholderia gladioli]
MLSGWRGFYRKGREARMGHFEDRFISRAEDLLADLVDMTEGCETEKLNSLGRFGWLLTVGRNYPDDEFLGPEEVDLLAQGENAWARGVKISNPQLAFVDAWINAREIERDVGLGVYCCIKLLVGDFRSDDEAVVLFRVASERYAFSIAKSGSAQNPAAEMAKLRHAENRSLIRDAVKHWRENIDPGLSAQKAATELTKIVPLSHKKLAEIISKAKKGFF